MAAAIRKSRWLEAQLVQGRGGVFDVEVDGKLIYSKDKTHRFPTDDEILSQI